MKAFPDCITLTLPIKDLVVNADYPIDAATNFAPLGRRRPTRHSLAVMLCSTVYAMSIKAAYWDVVGDDAVSTYSVTVTVGSTSKR